MKRFYLVAALAATAMAAAFFTSCDKQDEVTPPQPESAALGFQSVVTAGLETVRQAIRLRSMPRLKSISTPMMLIPRL